MLFEFRLRPLDEVAPWGRGEQILHWFGLTDGYYWIEAGGQQLLRFSDETCEPQARACYCEYYVARLYEDILEMFAQVMDPVPSDLVPYLHGPRVRAWEDAYATWLERLGSGPDDDRSWELYDDAVTWMAVRTLHTNYLTPPTKIRFWSDDACVVIAWDNTQAVIDGIPAWSAQSGGYRIARDAFVGEVHSFHGRLMQAMQERVAQVIAGGLPRAIAVDLEGMEHEQLKRAEAIRRVLTARQASTDWADIREAIQCISGAMDRDA